LSRKWFGAVFLLLLLSLILNVYTVAKLLSMEALLSSKPDSTTVENLVKQTEGVLRSLIRDIREEQQWYTQPTMEVQENGEDKYQITFSWQLREYPKQGHVLFFVRDPGSEAFKPLEVNSFSEGSFQARMQVDVDAKFKPVVVVSCNVNGKPVSVSEGTFGEPGPIYEYYIAYETNGIVRNSRVFRADLGKLMSGLTAPLDVRLDMEMHKSQLSLSVAERGTKEPKVKVSAVYLEAFRGEEKVIETRVPVAQDEKHFEWQAPVYRVSYNTQGITFDELCLRVEYDNDCVATPVIFRQVILK